MVTARRTARRPSAVGIARTARRATAWNDELFNFTLVAASSSQFLVVQDVSDPEKRGCTLIRTLLDFAVLAETPGAVSGSSKVSLGLALASDDAFVGGSLPDPEVQADYPVDGWLWRWSGIIIDETLATGHVPPRYIKEDLRAARKMDRSSVYMAITNDLLEGTAFTVRIIGIIRMLYKLP